MARDDDRDLTFDDDGERTDRRYDRAYDERGERRHPILNLIFLGLVIAAVVFAVAPWFAFRALRAAAQYDDVAAVSELVDFNAVRKALSLELGAQQNASPITAEPPSIWRDPLGAMRRVLGPIAPPRSEPAIDRYLSINGLSALTRGYAPGAAPPVEPAPTSLPEQAKAMVGQPFPQIAYWDPNRVRIAVERPGAREKVTVFTFERRDWFTWKLVQIGLPAGETKPR
jgi:hypothetical protein